MQTDTGVSRQLEAPTESAAPNFPLNPPESMYTWTLDTQFFIIEFS